MRQRLFRWAAPLGSGLALALLLGVFLFVFFRRAEAGLSVLFEKGFTSRWVTMFGVRFVLTLVLPFYLVTALFQWGLTLVLGSAFRRGFSEDWRALEGFGLTLSALVWAHLVLWWQVPTTLWRLPGLRVLPFWLLFPLLVALTLAYPVRWLRRARLGWIGGPFLLVLWMAAWTVLPLAPERLPRLLTAAKGGSDNAQVLIVGLDGLREDLGTEVTANWPGVSYENAWTVIPATRLLWHILWGGDPLFFTVGHAPPALTEFQGQQPLPIIQEADHLGWKPRFYIDDGGTIGLAGRPANFDDVLMPAPGWENFVNSNLTASFPLFAVWENWGRAFPTTNPWAPLDGGLREALRLGRGSKMVMFHSCLAHVPIFLRRDELASIHHWWTLNPMQMEPWVVRQQVTLARALKWDPRTDPMAAYSLRMESILHSWEPIWRELAQDPQYGQATRILFSDHGEHFYRATPQIHLGGVHGYNLDPWEGRITLKVAGPGFEAPPGAAPSQATISVLSIRDALDQALQTGKPFSRKTLETSYPVAPMRYQTISRELLTDEKEDLYRQMGLTDLTTKTGIAPEGIWFTIYEKSAQERSEEVSLAWGRGPDMEVVKPLKAGGAHRITYKGYVQDPITTVSEEAYKQDKEAIKQLLARHTPGTPVP